MRIRYDIVIATKDVGSAGITIASTFNKKYAKELWRRADSAVNEPGVVVEVYEWRRDEGGRDLGVRCVTEEFLKS